MHCCRSVSRIFTTVLARFQPHENSFAGLKARMQTNRDLVAAIGADFAGLQSASIPHIFSFVGFMRWRLVRIMQLRALKLVI